MIANQQQYHKDHKPWMQIQDQITGKHELGPINHWHPTYSPDEISHAGEKTPHTKVGQPTQVGQNPHKEGKIDRK